MCHIGLPNTSVYDQLQQIDEIIAADARASGCAHCGSTLHQADYPRKPRGGPDELPKAYWARHSFCCAVCRRRRTPPSLRFLGRKVYLAAIVVVASIFQHGVTTNRVARLQALLDDGKSTISWQTLKRWRWWWQESLPASRFWKARSGDLMPPVDPASLPASLFERFSGEVDKRLAQLLHWLSPVTTTSSPEGMAV